MTARRPPRAIAEDPQPENHFRGYTILLRLQDLLLVRRDEPEDPPGWFRCRWTTRTEWRQAVLDALEAGRRAPLVIL